MPRRHEEHKKCSTHNFFDKELKKLEPKLLKKTKVGISSAIRKLRNSNKEINIFDKDKHELIDANLIADSSYKSYTKQFRGFFRFLALIGDYDSMLVFHNQKCKFITESMKSESVAMYIIYKTEKVTQLLRKVDNANLTVKDVFGKDIKCRGEWNFLGNADQFLNAITAIHVSISQDNNYTTPCTLCVQSRQKNINSTGCNNHAGEFRFYRRGNPRYCKYVKSAMAKARELTSGHESRRCPQLLPVDIERLRKILFTTNKLSDYQLYVMLLLGIHLFLRFDELANFKIDQYLPQYSIVMNGKVEKILFTVQGKCDKNPVILQLKRNDEFMHLCPVRHLLFYVHITKLRKGYLFPDFIHNKERYEYKFFNNMVKDLIKDKLGREDNISSHILRNTGYLFAVFGKGTVELIRRAARHKSVNVALAYYADAETMYRTLLDTDSILENVVPVWTDILVANQESYLRLHHTTQRNLDIVASLFVKEVFGRTLNLPMSNNKPYSDIITLLEELMKKKQKHTLVDEMIEALEKQGANENVIHTAVHFVNKVTKEKKKTNERQLQEESTVIVETHQLLANDSNEAGSTNSEEEARIPEVDDQITSSKRKNNDTCNKSNKYKRRKGSEDIAGRELLKNKKGLGKLDLIINLYCKTKEIPKKEFTSGARTFFYNVLKPINDCFTVHFKSNVDDFLKTHSLSDHSRFNRNCCTGTGLRCNIRNTHKK